MTQAEYQEMLAKAAALDERIAADPNFVYSDDFIRSMFSWCMGPVHSGFYPDLPEDVRQASHLAVEKHRIPPDYDAADYSRYVAMVVGQSIRHVRRHGRDWYGFISPWRIRLDELVEQGNASAKVVKDWICGNRAFLSGDVIRLLQHLSPHDGGSKETGGHAE